MPRGVYPRKKRKKMVFPIAPNSLSKSGRSDACSITKRETITCMVQVVSSAAAALFVLALALWAGYHNL